MTPLLSSGTQQASIILADDTISLSGEVAYLSVDERAVKQMVGGATLWYEQDT